MNSPDRSLSTALRHHQSGRLDAAAEIYHDILADAPHNADARHLLGLVAFQSGNFELAVNHIRRAIRLNSRVAVYHSNLGAAYSSLKQFDAAAASFRQAIKLAPNDAEAYNNLGKALRDQGHLEQAVIAWRRAIALKPHYDDAWSNLAAALRLLGRGDESVACLRELVRLRPDRADFCNNLGSALNEHGNLGEAVTLYRRAIQLEPNYAPPHNNLGNALQQRGQLAEACQCYARAIELTPDCAEIHVGLASTLNELGKSSAAIQHYSMAIQIKPGLAAAHHNLGVVLQEQGDFARAEKCFRAAIAADSRYAAAHADLAALLRSNLPAEDLAVQQRLLSDQTMPREQQATLHFGLAQVYDARGFYERAAEHANAANALRAEACKSAGREYDPAAHADFVNGLIAEFTPEFFARVHDFGVESERPVFVVGLPRSGTTLVEQILASHSQVFGAGELTLARDAFTASCVGPRHSVELSGLDRDHVRQMALRHLEELDRRNAHAPRVIDKFPANYLYLGFLSALFPRARFIHCRRDLRDVAVSCWVTNFREVPWANDPAHLASHFRECQRLMSHWHYALPAPILEISYEETVANLESVARRLVSWCGLDWEAKCLDFHRNRGIVRTASAVQVRQPLYGTSVGRWRHYEQSLSEVLAAIVSAIAE
jgi:tetratricopeptide (TPR) repeat protein